MFTLSRIFTSIAFSFSAAYAFSFSLSQGHSLFEVGAYNSNQGQSQFIGIQGLIGDQFTVTNHNDTSFLFGLGYFLDGANRATWGVDYGINVFYLNKTSVSGIIFQELLFPNLAYSYSVRHVPVYATAKAAIKTSTERATLTLDAGVGPNFTNTSNYHDWSTDGGITLPDHAFYGRSDVVFSAMAGIGLKVDNILSQRPLECGYRFFYLGQANFNSRTNQILNNLSTGPNYANAILCSVTI